MNKKEFIKNRPFDEADGLQMQEYIEDSIKQSIKNLLNPGVVNGLQVSTTSSGMGITITPGVAYDSSYNQIKVSTSQSIMLDVSDINNPRYDVIIATYKRTTVLNSDVGNKYGNGTSFIYSKNQLDDFTISVVKGTPNAVAAIPSIPTDAVKLAHIYIPAKSTTILSNNISNAQSTLIYALSSDIGDASTLLTNAKQVVPAIAEVSNQIGILSKRAVSILKYESLVNNLNPSGKDWTQAIQQAFNDAVDGDMIEFPNNINKYTCGSGLTITNKQNLSIVGKGIIKFTSSNGGIQLVGTNKDITIQGLWFEGDGTVNVAVNGAIWNYSGVTVENISIERCFFKNIPFGVYLNADTSGSYLGAVVERCLFYNIIGVNTGQGDGVAIAGIGRNIGTRIVNNYFENCERHSCYVSSATQTVVSGNFFRNHRKNIDTSSAPYQLPALSIGRSEHVVVTDNVFDSCNDVAMDIFAIDSRGTYHVEIADNTFRNNKFNDIKIGTDTPNVNGDVKYVRIHNNIIERNGNNTSAPIIYLSGLYVYIEENTIISEKLTQDYASLIEIYGYGTKTYSDKVRIRRNTLIGKTTVGSTKGIWIHSQVCTGNNDVKIYDNDIDCTYEIYFGGNLTNPKVKFGRDSNFGSIDMPANNTAITITHGLATTPSTILVTPHGNVGNVWVSTINSTNFTINCSVAPTANTKISWKAEM